MPRHWFIPLLLVSLVGCAFVVTRTMRSGRYTDFAAIYQSAVALRTGGDLYINGDPTREGNLNPPHVVWSMLPLSHLPLAGAAVVGWVMIGMSVVAVAWLLRGAVGSGAVLMTLAVVLATPAGYLSVRFINLSWPLALGVTWAWLAMRKGQVARAGAMLGVLATVKLFLLLFLPYLLWRRHWKAVVSGVVAGAMVIVAGVMVTGVDAYQAWFTQLRAVRWQALAINVSVLGALRRNLDAAAPGGFAPVANLPELVIPLWILVGGAVVGLMAARFRGAEDVDREWTSVLVATLLLSPLGWSYYWAIVVGPMAAVASVRRLPPVTVVGVVLCAMPFLVLDYGQPAPAFTLTLATSYTWGALIVWVWVTLGLRGSTQESGPAVPAIMDDAEVSSYRGEHVRA